MPNVTIHIPAEKMPPEHVLSALTERCTALCTDGLRAAPENIHIVYVGVRHGRGRPIFVDVQYRLEPFRTAPVMTRFMEALDDAIRESTGVTARIRCFGHDASHLHARN